MKDDKSFSNSSRADKALHLIAATVLCGAVLNAPIEALSLQSSVSADVVSQSSKSKQILTKYLQEKHKQKAKIDKQKFLEAIKEQQEAKGQTSRTDENSKVRVIVTLDADAAVDHTAKPTGSTESVKKIEKAVDKVKGAQADVRKQVEKISGSSVKRSFGYLVNGFSIDVKVSDLQKIQDLKGVASVKPVRVYYPADSSANEMADVQKVWQNHKLKGEGMVVSIIDTGIDYNHKDLKLDAGTKTALSKNSVEAKAKEFGHGKFYTDKVPYGYNYADGNDNVIDNGNGDMHGQHVAGIAAANGTGADSVKGVAPDAQLLAMKVFSNNGSIKGCYDDDLIAAIEDSVKLGANVINMSLGSVSSNVDENDPEQSAVRKASEQGVLCVISAGNSSVSTSTGSGNPDQQFDSDELSTVGAPGITPEALTVASSENEKVVSPTMRDASGNVKFDSISDLTDGSTVINQQETDYAPMTGEHKVVSVGTGSEDEYDGKDVKGQIALVKRGAITFSEKVNNAKAHGAVGVIIYNNEGTDLISMAIDDKTFPTVGASLADGEKLEEAAAAGKTINLKFERQLVTNVSSGKMSDFSSWGPTPALDFKPEISAPGGKIYSLANNDKYQQMSGTSMASPFVAGSEALILQGIKNRNLGLSGKALTTFAKNSVLNTATPMKDKEHTKEIISPRRQGAGQINVDRAVKNNVSATYDKTGLGTVALKEIGLSASFTVTLHNYGSKDETYSFNDYGGVYRQKTDDNGEIYDTKIDKAKISTDKNTITVKAGESKQVTFNLSLPQGFEKQQFVEGYVGFEGKGDAPNLVVPYMGFYGTYSKGQIVGKMLYEDDWNLPTYAGFLTTNDGNVPGLYYDDEKGRYNVDADSVAFSPENEDGINDYVEPSLYYLRNYKKSEYQIVDKDGKVVKNLGTDYDGVKDYYSASSGKWTTHNEGKWDGTLKDKNGRKQYAPDGTYQYKITTTPVTDGDKQVSFVKFKIDNTAPSIKDLKIREDGRVEFSATDGKGVGVEDVALLVNDNVVKTDLTLDRKTNKYVTKDSVASEFVSGRNYVYASAQDKAGNIGFSATSQVKDAEGVLYFNVGNDTTITQNTEGFDSEKKTFDVSGTYEPNETFFINGQEVKTDGEGYFTASVSVKAGDNVLTASKDKDGKNVLSSVKFKADLSSARISVDGLDEATETVTAPASTYKLTGSVEDAKSLTLKNESTKESATDVQIVGGKFSQDLNLNYGDNVYTLTAVSANGNVSTKTFNVRTTDSTTYNGSVIDFDNLESGVTVVGKTTTGYDAEKGELTITGKLKYPVDVFKIQGKDVQYDKNTLAFSYTATGITNGSKSLPVFIQSSKLNEGKPVVDYGFILWVDGTAPSLQFENMTADANGKLTAYTNKNPYELKAKINDNLSGYLLTVDGDAAFTDKDYYLFNEDFFKGRSAADVSYGIDPVVEGTKKVAVSLKDSAGNVTDASFTLAHHAAKLKAPVVTPNTSKKAQTVVLSAAVADFDKNYEAPKLYVSTDGSTWSEVPDGKYSVAANGEYQFKYADVYGNESETTKVGVNNVVDAIYSDPTAKLSSTDGSQESVTVTLGFDKEDTDQTFNHLRYRFEGETEWKNYDKPFTVDKDAVVEFQSYDDAGNESRVLKTNVIVKKKSEQMTGKGSEDDDKRPGSGQTAGNGSNNGGKSEGNSDVGAKPGSSNVSANGKSNSSTGANGKESPATGDDVKNYTVPGLITLAFSGVLAVMGLKKRKED